MWINTIGHVNEDGGNTLQPKVNSQVCSLHLVTGKPNPKHNPDYLPFTGLYYTGAKFSLGFEVNHCCSLKIKGNTNENFQFLDQTMAILAKLFL